MHLQLHAAQFSSCDFVVLACDCVEGRGRGRGRGFAWKITFDFVSLFPTSSTSRAHFDGTVIIASSLEISEVHRILSVENFNSRLKCFRSAWMARLHRTTKGKVWFASNPEIYEHSESKALATRGRRHLVRRSTPPMPCTKNTPVTAASSISHVPHNESTENSKTKNNIHQYIYVCLSIYPSFFLTSSPDLHVFGQAEWSQPSRLLGTLKDLRGFHCWYQLIQSLNTIPIIRNLQ